MQSPKKWHKELQAALIAAERASEVLLSYRGRLEKVRQKPDSGLVSEADEAAEASIFKTLKELGVEAPFLAEEQWEKDKDWKENESRRWIIDPLDGTTNFLHGFPFYSVSIALQVDQEIKVGVVQAPELGMRFWSAKGYGSFKNGEKIVVRQQTNIHESFLATGFNYLKDEELEKQVRSFTQMVKQTYGVRRAGSAALDLCLVASGVFDAFWERGLKAWDTAAGWLIVEEAGGLVTDYFGAPYEFGNTCLASVPGLQKEIVKIITEAERF